MIIQQTIDIPVSRRITLDIPQEIPAGKVILTFTPAPAAAKEIPDRLDAAAIALGYKDDRDYLRANTPTTIEEAIAQAQAKLADPKHTNFFKRYYGALEGEDAYGDGIEYQRKMRDEWPD